MAYVAFSLREAARLTGLSHGTVAHLTITMGVGTIEGGRWLFSSDDIRRMREERPRPGRPVGWRKRTAVQRPAAAAQGAT